MPTTNKPNWFTRATLNAQMAEAPAIMQASGWNSDPNKGVTIGDPNEAGAKMLADALKQIGLEGISSFAGDIALEALSKYVLPVVKSRPIYNKLSKAYYNAPTLNQARNHIYPNYNPGDVTDWALFLNDSYDAVTLNKRLGNITLSRLNSELPKIKVHRSVEAAKKSQKALDNMEQLRLKTNKTWRQLYQEKKDLQKAVEVPGRKTSLVMDEALSTDSAPIGYNGMVDYYKSGHATIIPVKDNGVYRMVKLNTFGFKHPWKDTKAAVDAVRSVSDPNLPVPVRFFGQRYVPAVEMLYKADGGLLKKYPKQ